MINVQDILNHLNESYKKRVMNNNALSFKVKLKQLATLINSLQSLLRCLIIKYSKEVDTITDLIQLHLFVFASYSSVLYDKDHSKSASSRKKAKSEDELEDDVEADEADEDSSLVNEPIREVVELTDQWLKKECAESLLINFGVNQRSQKEIDEHEHELKSLSEAKSARRPPQAMRSVLHMSVDEDNDADDHFPQVCVILFKNALKSLLKINTVKSSE